MAAAYAGDAYENLAPDNLVVDAGHLLHAVPGPGHPRGREHCAAAVDSRPVCKIVAYTTAV